MDTFGKAFPTYLKLRKMPPQMRLEAILLARESGVPIPRGAQITARDRDLMRVPKEERERLGKRFQPFPASGYDNPYLATDE